MLDTPIQKSFYSIARSRQVVIPALKVSLFVGTLLAFINHGGKLVSLNLNQADLLKVLLTYVVPYGVSTWSAVKAIQVKD